MISSRCQCAGSLFFFFFFLMREGRHTWRMVSRPKGRKVIFFFRCVWLLFFFFRSFTAGLCLTCYGFSDPCFLFSYCQWKKKCIFKDPLRCDAVLFGVFIPLRRSLHFFFPFLIFLPTFRFFLAFVLMCVCMCMCMCMCVCLCDFALTLPWMP